MRTVGSDVYQANAIIAACLRYYFYYYYNWNSHERILEEKILKKKTCISKLEIRKMIFPYFSFPPQKIESVASNKHIFESLNLLLLATDSIFWGGREKWGTFIFSWFCHCVWKARAPHVQKIRTVAVRKRGQSARKKDIQIVKLVFL